MSPRPKLKSFSCDWCRPGGCGPCGREMRPGKWRRRRPSALTCIGPAPPAMATTARMACRVWEHRLQLWAAALCGVGEGTRNVAGGGAHQHRCHCSRYSAGDVGSDASGAEMGVSIKDVAGSLCLSSSDLRQLRDLRLTTNMAFFYSTSLKIMGSTSVELNEIVKLSQTDPQRSAPLRQPLVRGLYML
jgi:hypothetical protein